MPTPHSPSTDSPTHAARFALLAANAAAVVALAWWVRVLDVTAAGVAAAAALLAGAVAWRARRTVVAPVLFAAAVGCLAAAEADRRERTVLAAEAGDDSRSAQRAFAERLVTLVGETQLALATAASAAAGGLAVEDARERLPAGAGVVLYDADRVVDWAGTTVIPTAGLWERAGVVSAPFDVVQYAVIVRDSRRAVATAVLASTPPADRLRPSLASAVGERDGVTFSVWDATAIGESFTADAAVRVGGTRLAITARTPSIGGRAAALDERTRTRGALILAVAAGAALIAMWRRGTQLWERVVALAIPAVALVITPLNSLSNVSRFFDAATYYAPIGGPFTSSLGALAISSGLLLFAVLAVLRARAVPRQRWAAALAVLVVALATPFLLRDLARGVTLPPRGAGTGLWLGWEMALFLAATSLLTAGVWAGQRALGRARGLPLWVAPVIGAGAALLGPYLLGDSARWPSWYPFLWVAAVAALALARRSRAVLFPSAFVAACGATTLLWGVTLRERVELANADVSALSNVDAGAAALLERFADDLVRPPVPADPAKLLARYAMSDLAVIEAPIVIAHWPALGVPVLLGLGAQARLDEVAALVADARAADVSVLRPLRAAPVSALALVVPHETGEATSVVLASRSQLNPTPAFAELLGLEGAPARPPYSLTITGPAAAGEPAQTPWIRRGSHLHADWALPSGRDERVRLHASVPFDAYDALLPRGMLIVLLNVFAVAVLWAVYLLADGALVRWLRMRRREWARSYRLRLGIALLAFFVVPALAFAFWSYRRLQADDRAARELLVRETLRRAAADADAPTGVRNVPSDVPLLVYRGGQLASASDSLLLSLAPTGLFLDARVRASLAAREELVATAPTRVGGREMLFGYRALAPGLIVAVPSRSDDAALEKRRSDLGVLVVLATILGAFAALGLSGFAARQLARPIGTLRGGALAVAGGSRAPLSVTDAPSEFVPVFQAFDRMARDLAASESQLSRAERVFAWGEMARQVAHEIKNPLTPIRLGVQHLVRAWRDQRPDFGTILEDNAERLLQEIDHLDATARSFSQYGTAPSGPGELETVDAAAVVRDVVALEAIGADGLDWRVLGAGHSCWVRSRAAELREVLLNLCENSRLAGAHRVELQVEPHSDGATRDGPDGVRITVRDDGEGMPPEVRRRVFDPHFSTRTSGSGLGLAISRRLVEEWGGGIDLESERGVGTAVHLRLIRAQPPRSAPAADGDAPAP